MNDEDNPNPDEILKSIQQEEGKKGLGKLKIFFGMSAGVGKTYSMLQEAHERLKEGINVVIGTINTHGRKETEALVVGLPQIPEKWVKYKDNVFEEMDLEKIIESKPDLVLVDELAHTNVPGSKHPKRWQDVLEILDAGINVYTTLNVQHLESRTDLVESITNIPIHETVPDLVIERATNIELVDIPPSELLERLREGKVYIGDKSVIAAQNFFKEDNLTALREIALRFTAEKVEHDLHGMMTGKKWRIRERLLVAISPAQSSQQLIRAARRLAFELDAPWIAVYVDTGVNLSPEDHARLNKHLQLAQELGAEVITTADFDLATALQNITKERNITRLVLGRTTKKKFWNYCGKSLLDKLEETNKQLDIMILRQDKITSLYEKTIPPFQMTSPLSSYWIAIGTVILLTLLGYGITPLFGYKAVGYVFLAGIFFLSFYVGKGPVFTAALLSALSWNFLFIPPLYAPWTSEREDIALVFIYFCTAAFCGMLTSRLREQEAILYKREERIKNLYGIVKQIVKSPNFQYMRANVIEKLKPLYKGEFDIIPKTIDNKLSFDNTLPILKDEKERSAALWTFANGKISGWSTDTLPSAEAIYFPIKFANTPIGVLVYRPLGKKTLTIDEMNFLQSVSDQIGFYLERYVFEERIQTQVYASQVQKLQEAILRLLSRGLQQPLQKLLEISQELLKAAFTDKERLLSTQINRHVRQLEIIIENVLAVSQFESGYSHYEKQLHPIKDLIDRCIQKVKPVINEHIIQTKLPDPALQLNFDFHLLELALNNLLINAITYSPVDKPIQIIVEPLEQEFKISVIDEGHGISEELKPYIFEKFFRAPGSKGEGIGIGLSLVKTVVDIHGGSIEVSDANGHGTNITLILPN